MNFKNPLFIGTVSAFAAALALGIPTALIPTGIYIRMIQTTVFDYVFLFATSGLIGAHIGLSFLRKSRKGRSGYGMIGGSIVSLFAFGCPICNVLLVSLFGSTALLLYFEPFRVVLGIISIAVLSLMVHLKIKCKKCRKTNN